MLAYCVSLSACSHCRKSSSTIDGSGSRSRAPAALLRAPCASAAAAVAPTVARCQRAPCPVAGSSSGSGSRSRAPGGLLCGVSASASAAVTAVAARCKLFCGGLSGSGVWLRAVGQRACGENTESRTVARLSSCTRGGSLACSSTSSKMDRALRAAFIDGRWAGCASSISSSRGRESSVRCSAAMAASSSLSTSRAAAGVPSSHRMPTAPLSGSVLTYENAIVLRERGV